MTYYEIIANNGQTLERNLTKEKAQELKNYFESIYKDENIIIKEQ